MTGFTAAFCGPQHPRSVLVKARRSAPPRCCQLSGVWVRAAPAPCASSRRWKPPSSLPLAASPVRRAAPPRLIPRAAMPSSLPPPLASCGAGALPGGQRHRHPRPHTPHSPPRSPASSGPPPSAGMPAPVTAALARSARPSKPPCRTTKRYGHEKQSARPSNPP